MVLHFSFHLQKDKEQAKYRLIRNDFPYLYIIFFLLGHVHFGTVRNRFLVNIQPGLETPWREMWLMYLRQGRKPASYIKVIYVKSAENNVREQFSWNSYRTNSSVTFKSWAITFPLNWHNHRLTRSLQHVILVPDRPQEFCWLWRYNFVNILSKRWGQSTWCSSLVIFNKLYLPEDHRFWWISIWIVWLVLISGRSSVAVDRRNCFSKVLCPALQTTLLKVNLYHPTTWKLNLNSFLSHSVKTIADNWSFLHCPIHHCSRSLSKFLVSEVWRTQVPCLIWPPEARICI